MSSPEKECCKQVDNNIKCNLYAVPPAKALDQKKSDKIKSEKQSRIPTKNKCRPLLERSLYFCPTRTTSLRVRMTTMQRSRCTRGGWWMMYLFSAGTGKALLLSPFMMQGTEHFINTFLADGYDAGLALVHFDRRFITLPYKDALLEDNLWVCRPKNYIPFFCAFYLDR